MVEADWVWDKKTQNNNPYGFRAGDWGGQRRRSLFGTDALSVMGIKIIKLAVKCVPMMKWTFVILRELPGKIPHIITQPPSAWPRERDRRPLFVTTFQHWKAFFTYPCLLGGWGQPWYDMKQTGFRTLLNISLALVRLKHLTFQLVTQRLNHLRQHFSVGCINRGGLAILGLEPSN